METSLSFPSRLFLDKNHISTNKLLNSWQIDWTIMRLKHQICTFVAILSTLIKVAAGNSPDMDMTFSNLSIKEGLSQSTILSSCQDDKGLMWFATHDGLNRYDGYEFTIYRNSAEDSTSIADNIIRKVHIDSKGRLWIGTDKGFAQMRAVRGSIFSSVIPLGLLVLDTPSPCPLAMLVSSYQI